MPHKILSIIYRIERHFTMRTKILILLFISIHASFSVPNPALVGYWQNWNDECSPYIPLHQNRQQIQCYRNCFAPSFGTHASMQFIPDGSTVQDFINDVHLLQSQNKKVLISIGGQLDPVTIQDSIDKKWICEHDAWNSEYLWFRWNRYWSWRELTLSKWRNNR